MTRKHAAWSAITGQQDVEGRCLDERKGCPRERSQGGNPETDGPSRDRRGGERPGKPENKWWRSIDSSEQSRITQVKETTNEKGRSRNAAARAKTVKAKRTGRLRTHNVER